MVEYGGGLLTETEINIPGSAKTFRNGDLCPDGKPGEIQVFVTHAGESAEQRLAGDSLQQYIPHDGDRIRIVFGPPEEPVTFAPETTFAEPTPAAESPLPSWTIPPCDRPAATIRASYVPAAPRPTTVVVDAWNSQGGICLRVESVVLQPLGVGLVLVNLTISNGSSADIVYEYAGFSVVNADGARFLASEQTPSPDLQTIHAFETKWAQLTFQAIKGVPLRELVWRPEGLPEIRVPLQGDVPITTE